MLLIPTRVDRSPIHGLGLFTTRTLPAGTPIWRYVPGFDRAFTPDETVQWPDPARKHLSHYGYFDATSARWFLGGDLAIFMNHSDCPNTGAPEIQGPAPITHALRDIAAGEEITCNYHAFDHSQKPVPASTTRASS